MTTEEFALCYEGWYDQYKEEMEQLRLQCYYSTITVEKILPIQQFMPFAWDNENREKPVYDPEGFQKMVDVYEKIKENKLKENKNE